MHKNLFLGLATSATLLTSCGVNQADYDKLKTGKAKLKLEIDNFKFGAERLASLVKSNYQAKRYAAKENADLLASIQSQKKHRASPLN